MADSSSGEFIFLGERLLQLQNNPIDVLSLVNNATGLNVQGLCSSFDELRQIVRSAHPDFIGLCETFLGSRTESLLHLPGYKTEYLNRSKMAKVGLVVYVSEYFPYFVRHDLSITEEGIFESVSVKIKTRSKPLIVGNIYRSRSGSVSSFVQIFDMVLEAIHQNSRELVIMVTSTLICVTGCVVQNSVLTFSVLMEILKLVFSVYNFSDSLPRRHQGAGFRL